MVDGGVYRRSLDVVRKSIRYFLLERSHFVIIIT